MDNARYTVHEKEGAELLSFLCVGAAEEWLYVGGNLSNLGAAAWSKWLPGSKLKVTGDGIYRRDLPCRHPSIHPCMYCIHIHISIHNIHIIFKMETSGNLR